ncbi:hypothetical protein Dsin_026412 [Dipteronia sinensis]|uniref:Expansin n=1 Tax=Dipteronia sinensis TaxID=43782 RepID=A0AAD9ZY62_9ROSI|nr:hypothetical protein Dsin_026412 [Dipteronia sinensis]
MAFIPLFTLIVIFSLSNNNFCFCFNPKLFYNVSKVQSETDWSPAGATWYGPANGAGSDGGACGYKDAVERAPFSSMISAGGPSLFYSGKGCGACYQVKCTNNVNAICSDYPVSVVITDECPGGTCASDSVHFDLSGAAFGAMATSGHSNPLHFVSGIHAQINRFEIVIHSLSIVVCANFSRCITRVECNYRDMNVVFSIDSGSNPYYFAVLIKYINGDGNLAGVDLQQASQSNTWLPMQQSWGAIWKLDSGSGLTAPFSLRLTSAESRKTIVANNVIPAGWQAGQTYQSHVNFDV